MTYEHIEGGRVPIKAWTRGVPVDEKAIAQLRETASVDIVGPHLAVMPDVHFGLGSTVGSVVPTRRAIIPACCGVDVGCGLAAVRTSLSSSALGDNAKAIYDALVAAIPHGRTDNGGPNDRGAWGETPRFVAQNWTTLLRDTFLLAASKFDEARAVRQLGTLGTGNHFIEVCLDESDRVWVMLHSGSRGIGNQIAGHHIAIAKRIAEKNGTVLPNKDLAWLEEGTPEFDAYFTALGWAQKYARINREVMMANALAALMRGAGTFDAWVNDDGVQAVQCHHNYVSYETHFGENLYITRKGAVSAKKGELDLIPGAMGRSSYVVRGLGNAESFHSCSHGAGRVMSRGEAKKNITLAQHAEATAGVVCRQDADVLDESPAAYKDVDKVIEAQKDLIEVVHTLRAVVCVKG